MKNTITINESRGSMTYTVEEFLNRELSSISHDGVYVTQLLIPNYGTGEWSLKNLNCKLRNVKNINSFMLLVNQAYYAQLFNSNTSRVNELKKLSEPTEKQALEISTRSEGDVILSQVIKNPLFTADNKNFIDNDSFMPCVLGTLTKDTTVFARLTKNSSVTLTSILSMIHNKEDKKKIQESLTSFTSSITAHEENEVYYGYTYRANSGLTEDIKKVYYKGRTISKDGTSKKQYDTKGVKVRQEILLAILEDLQNKANTMSETAKTLPKDTKTIAKKDKKAE